MTWRLLYVPQVPQTVCCSLGARHRSQVDTAGATVFHWLRREWVLLRDVRRFGTAMSVLSQRDVSQATQGTPARIVLIMPVLWSDLVEVHTTAGT